MTEDVLQKLNEIETVGAVTDDILVKISYDIIDLFSGGLYSSPHKAIEELVANSYDAYAGHAHVIVSQPIAASKGAYIF
jgi:hypothetical protein